MSIRPISTSTLFHARHESKSELVADWKNRYRDGEFHGETLSGSKGLKGAALKFYESAAKQPKDPTEVSSVDAIRDPHNGSIVVVKTLSSDAGDFMLPLKISFAVFDAQGHQVSHGVMRDNGPHFS